MDYFLRGLRRVAELCSRGWALHAAFVLWASLVSASPVTIPVQCSMRTVDPKDAGFSDLEPLAALVGSSQVVQLGEMSHGFGTSFDARIRITKFLHEKLGFDVVLFETPFCLSRETNRMLAGSEELASVIDRSIFPIWAHSEQMLELFQYIRESKDGDRPIDLLGVDAQLLGFDGENELLMQGLREVLISDPDPVLQESLDRLASLLEILRPDTGAKLDAESYRLAQILLTNLEYRLDAPSDPVRRSTSPADRAWWAQVVRTLGHIAEGKALKSMAPPFRGDIQEYAQHPAVHAAQNRRDQAMASNIAWIAREYCANRRIVVWLANGHAQEVPGVLVENKSGFPSVRQHTTGSYLCGMLGHDSVFTVLHTAYSGAWAGNYGHTSEGYVWSQHELEAAPVGTVSAALHDAGLSTGIVDLKEVDALGLMLRECLDGDVERVLSKYGDALLFVDREEPSRRRKAPPTW